MTTAMDNAGSIPISADAKLRVTVEAGAQPVGKSTLKDEKGSVSLKTILSSLAETRKYLPDQVYSFLDSMEGKTLDDLRMEAMNLANKAQEEAKKRAGDVTNLGKSMVDNANNKVQGVADKAKQQTTDVANGLVSKGLQVVEPPIASTKAMTKSLAQRAMENTYNIAEKTLTFSNERFVPYVTPYLAPVTSRARSYLPESAKTFLEQNVDGKTIYELRNVTVLGARKALLNVDKNNEPTISEVAGEIKDAAASGALFTNALSLGEKAAGKVFGGTLEVPKDASALRRMYNLTLKVTGGIRTYANNQINSATQKALDMAAQRADAAKSMAMGRVYQVKDSIAPVAERIGATPVVPSFVYRLLRGPEGKGAGGGASADLKTETEKEKTSAPATLPTTTVRVDIIGMQPKDAPQATVPPSTTKTKGNTDMKDMETSSSDTMTNDTNAGDMGNLGDAGMGVTTTGSEAPTSAKGLDDPSSTQVKKGKKQQNKL